MSAPEFFKKRNGDVRKEEISAMRSKKGGTGMKISRAKWLAAVAAAAMMVTACGGGSSSTAKGTAAGVSSEAGKTETDNTEAAQNTSEEKAGAAEEGAAGTDATISVADADAVYRDTLNIAVAQQAPSLDLHKNSTLIARQMMDGTCWEKLVTLNSNGEAVPELCESYDVSEDAKTITFNLRKGVKFHDGSEMTADDVVASMNRWINGFSTAAAMVGDARFEKLDDYTVQIAAAKPIVMFPGVIAGAAQPASITAAEACTKEDTNGFMTEYIGTGPYKFVEWVQDQYVKLEKFEDYVPYGTEGEPMDGWSGYKAAPTKTLIFWIVPESNTRNAGLESGQYDVVYNLPSDDVDRMKGIDGITVFSTQQGTIAPIINHKKGLCSNQWFRQAVSYALDYEEVMAATYGTNGYVTGSCYMDEAQPFWYTDAGSEEYNVHDPEKAKKILEENGYDGTPMKLMAATLNKMDYMAVVMESELEEIGIPVELNIVDWPTLQAYSTDPDAYDMYICTFAQVPIPSLKLYFGPNYAGWNDDETLQSLLSEMNTATSMEDARAAWEKVQEYSWEYLAVINFGHYIANYAWNDHVKGLNAYSGMYFWNAGYIE